ncbi:MAG: hypothetical protein ACRD2L_10060, partial [Terriglobia bacterium]
FSIGTAYLIYSMLMASIRDTYYSVCLTLLFAFSATWWKFSTDANVYVPSVFFLVLAASKLQKRASPNWVAIGLIHAVSMLLHQIAAFFYPVVLIALFRNAALRGRKRALRDAGLYTAVAAGTVFLSYAWVWFCVVKGSVRDSAGTRYAQVDTSGVRTVRVDNFLSWVVSHGNEEYSFRSLTGNVQETLRSNVRLFFGGRFSLALRHIETPMLVILGVLLVCSIGLLALTLWETFRSRPIQRKPAAEPQVEDGLPLLLTWIGSFATFLFLWLTEYPYYRLFYLPALILLLGVLIKRKRQLPADEQNAKNDQQRRFNMVQGQRKSPTKKEAHVAAKRFLNVPGQRSEGILFIPVRQDPGPEVVYSGCPDARGVNLSVGSPNRVSAAPLNHTEPDPSVRQEHSAGGHSRVEACVTKRPLATSQRGIPKKSNQNDGIEENCDLVEQHADSVNQSDLNPIWARPFLQFGSCQHQKEHAGHVDIGIRREFPPGGREREQQREANTVV